MSWPSQLLVDLNHNTDEQLRSFGSGFACIYASRTCLGALGTLRMPESHAPLVE